MTMITEYNQNLVDQLSGKAPKRGWNSRATQTTETSPSIRFSADLFNGHEAEFFYDDSTERTGPTRTMNKTTWSLTSLFIFV